MLAGLDNEGFQNGFYTVEEPGNQVLLAPAGPEPANKYPTLLITGLPPDASWPMSSAPSLAFR